MKVGRVSLDSRIRSEIAKDEWLLENSDITGIHRIDWVFYESDVTGKIGPTASVIEALDKAGIGYQELDRYVYR